MAIFTTIKRVDNDDFEVLEQPRGSIQECRDDIEKDVKENGYVEGKEYDKLDRWRKTKEGVAYYIQEFANLSLQEGKND